MIASISHRYIGGFEDDQKENKIENKWKNEKYRYREREREIGRITAEKCAQMAL